MKIAVVCSMNQNRSMALHSLMTEAGLTVRSFGTSDVIRLPGESQSAVNAYPYGITYAEILEDLIRKNATFYSKCGIIKMLQRNMEIKEAPEYFFSVFKANGVSSYDDTMEITGEDIPSRLGSQTFSEEDTTVLKDTMLGEEGTPVDEHAESGGIGENIKRFKKEDGKSISPLIDTEEHPQRPVNKQDDFDNNFDLIISCDKLCFEKIFRATSDVSLHGREAIMLGFNIKDSIQCAVISAQNILELVQSLEKSYRKTGQLLNSLEDTLREHFQTTGEGVAVALVKLNW